MMQKYRFPVFSLFSAVLVLVVDRILKTSIELKVVNPGVALGLSVYEIFIVASFVVISAIWIYLLIKQKQKTLAYLLGLVVFASFSNLLDRMFLGGVVDYIQVARLWFNLADAVIVFGGVAILINIFVIKK